jgi:hypothetical protein
VLSGRLAGQQPELVDFYRWLATCLIDGMAYLRGSMVLSLVLAAAVGLLGACASSTENDAGATSNGGSGGSGTTAPPPQECPEAGCGEGQACVEVVPGGVRACRSATPPEPASDCPDHPVTECCDNSECESGLCVASVYAPTGECGLGGFDSINVCYHDECDTDDDCSNGEVCAWGGTEGVQRQCLLARCTRDADCTDQAGGRCVIVTHDCIYSEHSGENERPFQLACAYPGSYCADNEDCGNEAYCSADDAGTRCVAY